jgi:leucyl aminopeptidase
MTEPAQVSYTETDLDAIADAEGVVAVVVGEDGKLDPAGRRVNRLTRGALERMLGGKAWGKVKPGGSASMAWPSGMKAETLLALRLDPKGGADAALKAGGAVGKAALGKAALVLAGNLKRATDIALGAQLRAYVFDDHKTGDEDEAGGDTTEITVMVAKPDEVRDAAADHEALARGIFLTRDLINEPANVLTTSEFARRLEALREIGLEVETLDEPALEELGMRTLLAVGRGSESPSKVVVMRWSGGGEAPPLALVGKGVVFDTGGISIKPAQGMEDMTMDMGGAGTVAGVMAALALRKARANVVGLVGLVENMPDGRAQRPGDVVRSMKGDTVEVINTDAEGRLVLADVMWYAQERFEPAALIDLATLTGAIIVSLGHENAGVFSNDDDLCRALLAAAGAEAEGAWRMPLGEAYDKALKSDIADMKNVGGGRWGGAITAAQFLGRFVRDGMPWCHIDIAGVAAPEKETPLAPAGASGWGVRTLDRLIRDRFEG